MLSTYAGYWDDLVKVGRSGFIRKECKTKCKQNGNTRELISNVLSRGAAVLAMVPLNSSELAVRCAESVEVTEPTATVAELASVTAAPTCTYT